MRAILVCLAMAISAWLPGGQATQVPLSLFDRSLTERGLFIPTPDRSSPRSLVVVADDTTAVEHAAGIKAQGPSESEVNTSKSAAETGRSAGSFGAAAEGAARIKREPQ